MWLNRADADRCVASPVVKLQELAGLGVIEDRSRGRILLGLVARARVVIPREAIAASEVVITECHSNLLHDM